jgi:hypothetical protein
METLLTIVTAARPSTTPVITRTTLVLRRGVLVKISALIMISTRIPSIIKYTKKIKDAEMLERIWHRQTLFTA